MIRNPSTGDRTIQAATSSFLGEKQGFDLTLRIIIVYVFRYKFLCSAAVLWVALRDRDFHVIPLVTVHLAPVSSPQERAKQEEHGGRDSTVRHDHRLRHSLFAGALAAVAARCAVQQSGAPYSWLYHKVRSWLHISCSERRNPKCSARKQA